MAEDFRINSGHQVDTCVTIEIQEDNIFEDAEIFDTVLFSDSVDLCTTGTSSRVTISDSTREYYEE